MTVTVSTRARRVPPHNLDAERALLGAMLLSPAAVDAAALTVTVEDFYAPAHGHIYAAVVALRGGGGAGRPGHRRRPVGWHRSARHLRGGMVALISLTAETPSTGSAGRYAGIVADNSTLRPLIAAAGEIAEAAYADPADVERTVDNAEAAILAVATGHADDTTNVTVADHVAGHVARLSDLAANGAPPGLRTGWTDLDKLLTPLRPGNCVVVAARPSTGKTAFALGLATSAALD